MREVSELDSDVFVKAYDYGILCDIELPETTKYRNKSGVAYFYIMDRLKPLQGDEAKIAARTMEDLGQMAKSGMQHEREGKRKRYLQFKTKYHLKEGDFEEDGPNPVAKAFDLFDRMIAAGVRHEDIHGDNIMQDTDGQYKLIDLEAAKLLGKS